LHKKRQMPQLIFFKWLLVKLWDYKTYESIYGNYCFIKNL
jgi:hypothetical protein